MRANLKRNAFWQFSRLAFKPWLKWWCLIFVIFTVLVTLVLHAVAEKSSDMKGLSLSIENFSWLYSVAFSLLPICLLAFTLGLVKTDALQPRLKSTGMRVLAVWTTLAVTFLWALAQAYPSVIDVQQVFLLLFIGTFVSALLNLTFAKQHQVSIVTVLVLVLFVMILAVGSQFLYRLFDGDWRYFIVMHSVFLLTTYLLIIPVTASNKVHIKTSKKPVKQNQVTQFSFQEALTQSVDKMAHVFFSDAMLKTAIGQWRKARLTIIIENTLLLIVATTGCWLLISLLALVSLDGSFGSILLLWLVLYFSVSFHDASLNFYCQAGLLPQIDASKVLKRFATDYLLALIVAGIVLCGCYLALNRLIMTQPVNNDIWHHATVFFAAFFTFSTVAMHQLYLTYSGEKLIRPFQLALWLLIPTILLLLIAVTLSPFIAVISALGYSGYVFWLWWRV